eukprot:TRINITY_DN8217_c1_g1_i3.p1 TRINITY_DN8217_c1_g1~~TRINITY_DN8217_c1_g1_i3.p1  ORF type:complete len:264 (-),score=41.35 TRINITY_DN8217_c1_g1_i3:38-829(-)
MMVERLVAESFERQVTASIQMSMQSVRYSSEISREGKGGDVSGKCPVCFDSRRLQEWPGGCGHMFCKACMPRLLEGEHRRCPLCRATSSYRPSAAWLFHVQQRDVAFDALQRAFRGLQQPPPAVLWDGMKSVLQRRRVTCDEDAMTCLVLETLSLAHDCLSQVHADVDCPTSTANVLGLTTPVFERAMVAMAELADEMWRELRNPRGKSGVDDLVRTFSRIMNVVEAQRLQYVHDLEIERQYQKMNFGEYAVLISSELLRGWF